MDTDEELVEWLADSIAWKVSDFYMDTPLHVAVQRGDGERVRALLSTPDGVAMIGHPDSMAQTALGYACAFGRHDLIDMLLRAGADVDFNLHLPRLCHAAMLGDLQYLGDLLSAGEPVNITDGAGQTALFWGVRGGHSDIVRMLLSVTGMDVVAQDSMSRTALMVRCSPVTFSNSACLTMILNKSKQIDKTVFVHRALRLNLSCDIEALMNAGRGYLDLRGDALEDSDVLVVAANLSHRVSGLDLRFNPSLTPEILPTLLMAIQDCPRLITVQLAGIADIEGSPFFCIQQNLNSALLSNREEFMMITTIFLSEIRSRWAPSSDADFVNRCASEFKDQLVYGGPGQFKRAVRLIRVVLSI